MKPLILVLLLALPLPSTVACQDQGGDDPARDEHAPQAEHAPEHPAAASATPAASAIPLPGPAEEDAARAAWAYVERNWHPDTGLVGATEHYDFLTSWDLGSVLAATFVAHQLELIGDEDYARRMGTTLRTLREMPLFQGAAFNKLYSATTGEMVDRQDRPSDTGYGWSVLDLGRILAWLKVIELRDPAHADAARAVAERMDYDRLIEDGYLIGGNLRSNGRVQTYVEGRIGYEQYAAEAFERWGHPAPNSADLHRNARPVEILGEVVYVDQRGGDRLTSEPFVMAGLEFGWSEDLRGLAESVLATQRERYERTGTVTVASEDAMTEAPYYFYYYCIYLDGEIFVVDAQGAPRPLDGPRWVSAKAAYGWHALLPDDYTALAVETVAPAFVGDRGWFSGVYEGRGGRAGSMNLNTAAVILEALLYRRTGVPLVGRQ